MFVCFSDSDTDRHLRESPFHLLLRWGCVGVGVGGPPGSTHASHTPTCAGPNEALTCQAGGLRRQEGAPRQEEKQAGFQQWELTEFGKFGQVTKTC